jgi:hypothetical protein
MTRSVAVKATRWGGQANPISSGDCPASAGEMSRIVRVVYRQTPEVICITIGR